MLLTVKMAKSWYQGEDVQTPNTAIRIEDGDSNKTAPLGPVKADEEQNRTKPAKQTKQTSFPLLLVGICVLMSVNHYKMILLLILWF